MTIKKVKYNKGNVGIVFNKNSPSGVEDELSLESCEDPSSEFKVALSAMGAYVPDLIDMPRKYAANGLSVIGVTISYSKGELYGFCISCKKDVPASKSPFCFNTPHIAFEDAPAFMGLSSITGAIRSLQYAAEDFVNGKRSQQKLNL